MSNENEMKMKILRSMVLGAYDLQKIRIQSGLRLYANFRAKLRVDAEEEIDDDEENEDGLSARAEAIIDQLRASYKRLTDGIAKNRTLPDQKKFIGDAVISTPTELSLAHYYFSLEGQERQLFRLLEPALDDFAIYTGYLKPQRGIGPAMAGVLMAYLDPAKARHPSSFWRYAGLDVGSDGRGRSRRVEHLVEYQYTDKKGQVKTRRGLSYNPVLKSKLLGVLATSFLRSRSPWVQTYEGYKHRINTDPSREKTTVAAWKKKNDAGEDVTHLWTPGRIHKAACRYMIKMFLAEFWNRWRTLEGLPTDRGTYAEDKLGRPHAA